MAHIVVTGAAGFIGSHLCERLLDEGNTVIGIDAFIPYYPRPLKERNLAGLLTSPRFVFHEADLRSAELAPLLENADFVFHTAAMAGLLKSWQQFDDYMTCNILATQRLLAAAVKAQVGHFLHCSTSSVYGRFATGDENSPLAPVSPYGITKLAAEQLCRAYGEKDGLRFTILRLFSVYGPRQRPDMGYNIFIRKLLAGETIVIDGDGADSRSNTYIADCVEGLLLAARWPNRSAGETFNIGGGEEVNVLQVLAILEELSGLKAITTHGPQRPGDQRRTVADIAKARTLLGYNPQTRIVDGLAAQLAWQRAQPSA
ncbi:MAG: NAD-dependent epimerase/dehydratase family protein [Caldilinea sp.]